MGEGELTHSRWPDTMSCLANNYITCHLVFVLVPTGRIMQFSALMISDITFSLSLLLPYGTVSDIEESSTLKMTLK
jgi:hypothetical protein